MRINDEGLAIVKTFEGLVDGDPDTPGLEPYYDPVGIPTIGWGSTWGLDGQRVTMEHPPITEVQAEALLTRETREAEAGVSRLIRVDLTEHEFSALVSFTYNLGSGNLQSSTLRQKLNRSDYRGASREFRRWVFAGGQKLPGLIKRRAAERALFLA